MFIECKTTLRMLDYNIKIILNIVVIILVNSVKPPKYTKARHTHNKIKLNQMHKVHIIILHPLSHYKKKA